MPHTSGGSSCAIAVEKSYWHAYTDRARVRARVLHSICIQLLVSAFRTSHACLYAWLTVFHAHNYPCPTACLPACPHATPLLLERPLPQQNTALRELDLSGLPAATARQQLAHVIARAAAAAAASASGQVSGGPTPRHGLARPARPYPYANPQPQHTSSTSLTGAGDCGASAAGGLGCGLRVVKATDPQYEVVDLLGADRVTSRAAEEAAAAVEAAMRVPDLSTTALLGGGGGGGKGWWWGRGAGRGCCGRAGRRGCGWCAGWWCECACGWWWALREWLRGRRAGRG